MFSSCLKTYVLTLLPKLPHTGEQRILLGQVDTKVGEFLTSSRPGHLFAIQSPILVYGSRVFRHRGHGHVSVIYSTIRI